MLDLRMPIGVYFTINCVILVLTGILQPSERNVGGQNINLNLVWGLVMGAFGAFMLGLVMMDKKKPAVNTKTEPTEPSSNE